MSLHELPPVRTVRRGRRTTSQVRDMSKAREENGKTNDVHILSKSKEITKNNLETDQNQKKVNQPQQNIKLQRKTKDKKNNNSEMNGKIGEKKMTGVDGKISRNRLSCTPSPDLIFKLGFIFRVKHFQDNKDQILSRKSHYIFQLLYKFFYKFLIC